MPAGWSRGRAGPAVDLRTEQHGHRLDGPAARRGDRPAGAVLLVGAGAILLATGARERPRAARLIPGDRPAGVYTTGQLQNLVHLHHRAPGTRRW